jgi:mannose-6-phosphate isomerase-like protein (cupin superfamily)
MRPIVRQIIFTAIASTALIGVATRAPAQAKKAGAPKRELTWGPAPDAFPAGAKMAVEKGDPTKSGEFVVRLSLPAGYKIPPHWHPTDEHVRIISGEFQVGMGDALDASKTMKMAPGDTGTIGAKKHHFAIAGPATEVRIRAEGPFAMTYVNPADDPRKKH